MVTMLLAALVTIVLVWGLVRGLVSGFLALLSLTALLAAFGLVPAGGGATVQMLVLATLWVEGGQLVGTGEGSPCPGLASAALVGLLGGSALWYGGGGPALLPPLGGFAAALFWARLRGLEVPHSLGVALRVVEDGAAGAALKLGLCGLLVVSLAK